MFEQGSKKWDRRDHVIIVNIDPRYEEAGSKSSIIEDCIPAILSLIHQALHWPDSYCG